MPQKNWRTASVIAAPLNVDTTCSAACPVRPMATSRYLAARAVEAVHRHPRGTTVLTRRFRAAAQQLPVNPQVVPRSPRFATEVERLHAGLEPLRRQELEMPRARQPMKQRRSAATDDGMNDDAVLVDEPQLLECSRELRRSDEDTSLGLRFERGDRLAKVTLHLDRVLPRKV